MGSLAEPNRPIAKGGRIRNCLIVNAPPFRSSSTSEDFADPLPGLLVETHQGAQIGLAPGADDLLAHRGKTSFLRSTNHTGACLVRRDQQVVIEAPAIAIRLRQGPRKGMFGRQGRRAPPVGGAA